MATATVRDALYRRAVRTMIVGASTFVVGLALAFFLLFETSWKLAGVALYAVAMIAGAVVGLRRVVRCPDCGFGMLAQQGYRLRRGHRDLLLNYCPHCGRDYDAPAGAPP